LFCFLCHSISFSKFNLVSIGFLKDYTKNYSLAFAIGGAMIIIAAFFHISLVCVRPEPTDEHNKQIDNEKLREKSKIDV